MTGGPFVHKVPPLTISESIIASAKVGTDQAQPMSDLERVARAIVTRIGFDPDRLAIAYTPERAPKGCWFLPPEQHAAPLWTFYEREAEAALSVLDI